MRHTVLFVCTGNICRSPMAAALFNSQIEKHGDRDSLFGCSAGTWATEGLVTSDYAISALARYGVALTKERGHQITRRDMEQADVIVVMTRDHRDALAAEFPAQKAKLHLMSELAGHEYDISDPYGGEEQGYATCAQELARLIDQGYGRIKEWAHGESR